MSTIPAALKPGSVKICSLREVEHAQVVLDAGADLFGLIFAPARRRVTVERAREIVDAVRQSARGRSLLAVGVFVDASVETVNEAIRAVGLDLVQLHGAEPPEMLAEIDAPAIKAFRPASNVGFDQVRREIARYAAAARPPIGYLVDGYVSGHFGGEGARADWHLAARLAAEYPVILAGGLAPDSVAEAIAAVDPIGVDVSSGVETNGVKDPAKIESFVANARAGFALTRHAPAGDPIEITR